PAPPGRGRRPRRPRRTGACRPRGTTSRRRSTGPGPPRRVRRPAARCGAGRRRRSTEPRAGAPDRTASAPRYPGPVDGSGWAEGRDGRVRLMRQYLELLDALLAGGEERTDRTGVGTLARFGWQSRYDLADGFPLVTTKRVHTKSVVGELLWFLAGRTDNGWL